jgi:hypothetical protein
VEEEGMPSTMGWAEQYVAKKAWLVSVEHDVIGQASKYFDGTIHKYVSAENGREVAVPVIEFDDGNAFIANDPEKFMELTGHALIYYKFLQKNVSDLLRMVMAPQSRIGIPRKSASYILISTLETVVNMLKAAHLQEEPSEVGVDADDTQEQRAVMDDA